MRWFDTFAPSAPYIDAPQGYVRGRARWLIVFTVLLIVVACAAPLLWRLTMMQGQQCERVPGAFSSGFGPGFSRARCACADQAHRSEGCAPSATP